MEILYIGKEIYKPQGGADQVNLRNQKLLKTIFENNVTFIESTKNSIYDKLTFNINNKFLEKISNILKNKEYSYVFIEQSLMGRAVKFIKRNFPNIKIVVFFHNIELQYAQEYCKVNGIKAYPFYFITKYWEKQSCKYADYCITLNKRDTNLLKKIYKREAKLELPTSFEDIFDINKVNILKNKNIIEKPIDYLFVGVAFFANINGIQWFIDNVMPKVEGNLYIIGKGMNNIKFKNLSNRIFIYGFVDDLAEYYYNAKMVVSPIFVGGGMKTKTAEALMYGKTILGTTEAFEGYEKNENCMHLCNTSEEFIENIKKEKEKKSYLINEHAREMFNSYYSNSSAEIKLKQLFL